MVLRLSEQGRGKDTSVAHVEEYYSGGLLKNGKPKKMHRLSKIPIQETKEILYITQKSFSNVFEPETIKVKNLFKFKLLHYWRSHLIQNKVWDIW